MLRGTDPGLARQDCECRVFGRLWNRTELFLQSESGPLAGYSDPLVTLGLGPAEWSVRQPYSFSDTMRLHVVHGCRASIGLSCFQFYWMRVTSGLKLKPVNGKNLSTYD
jgi:hypothetical protein